MTDKEIIDAHKLIKNLQTYCFLSQSTFRKMRFNFCQNDFDFLHKIVDSQNAQIKKLKCEVKKDCKFYKNDRVCIALRELYCKCEVCKFYKSRKGVKNESK